MFDVPKSSPTSDFIKGYLVTSLDGSISDDMSMSFFLAGTPRTPVREKEKVSVQTPLERVRELGQLVKLVSFGLQKILVAC